MCPHLLCVSIICVNGPHFFNPWCFRLDKGMEELLRKEEHVIPTDITRKSLWESKSFFVAHVCDTPTVRFCTAELISEVSELADPVLWVAAMSQFHRVPCSDAHAIMPKEMILWSMMLHVDGLWISITPRSLRTCMALDSHSIRFWRAQSVHQYVFKSITALRWSRRCECVHKSTDRQGYLVDQCSFCVCTLYFDCC